MSKSEQKRLLDKVIRLERQVEAGTKDKAADGYALNKQGLFEPIGVRDKEFEAYRELISKFPEEDYYTYLFAASLSRSGFLDEAVKQYGSIVEGGGAYSHPAQKMLACTVYEQGQTSRAQELLDAYNQEAARRGEKIWHEKIEQIYAS